MNRRRILTGLVAAPFVARLGLLMPVRPVLASTPGWRKVLWGFYPGGQIPIVYGYVSDAGEFIGRDSVPAGAIASDRLPSFIIDGMLTQR